jgi:ferritin
MIGAAMQKGLNEQINKEFYSAYLYLSFSTQCARAGFPGMAAWFRKQYEEETRHGLKIVDHLVERGGEVQLAAVAAPAVAPKSPLAFFEKSLEHERTVTASIHTLAGLSMKEKDFAVHGVLAWFVSEQVEEEASVQVIIDELKLAGDNGAALLMIDHRLGKRE